MNWVVIEETYLAYLRKFDSHVPFSNYGPNKFKPFFGTLFEVNNELVFLAQVSHPQPKHFSKKDDYSFKKLIDPKSNKLLAVVNLSYMFPIKKSDLIPLSYSQIQNYRTFTNNSEKSKYIDLLSKELKIINMMDLGNDAKKLYSICEKYPDSQIAQSCNQFKLLEEKAVKYST